MASQMHDERQRTEQREERSQGRNNPAWLGGAILILLGVVFLFSNMGMIRLSGNWWAYFLFIPVVAALVSAWQNYQANGYLTRVARGTLTGALFPLAIGLIFLLNLNWGAIWPIFLVLADIAALVNGMPWSQDRG